MAGPADRDGQFLIQSDDPERERFVQSLGHVGLMPVEPGAPTPEQVAADNTEYMETLNRGALLHLRELARRGEDGGKLEEFRRREQQRRDSELRECAESLQAFASGESSAKADTQATHQIRRPRLRARRVGCTRRRGSRRSAATASRAGPGDDPGESDPGDDLPLVAGVSKGAGL